MRHLAIQKLQNTNDTKQHTQNTTRSYYNTTKQENKISSNIQGLHSAPSKEHKKPQSTLCPNTDVC